MSNGKNAVSAAQFAKLRGRVKSTEDRLSKVEGSLEESGPAADIVEVTGLFRRLMSNHPRFTAAVLVMSGFLLGCIICDFHTFGGY